MNPQKQSESKFDRYSSSETVLIEEKIKQGWELCDWVNEENGKIIFSVIKRKEE
jgi:hypothetical protein